MTELLVRADPLRDIPIPDHLDARAETDLATILAARPTASPAVGWARWARLAAAAAAAAALILAFGFTHLRAPSAAAAKVALPVLTATPFISGTAPDRLAHLADLATALPAPGPTVRYRGWSLTARIDGKTVDTAIVTTDTELTRHADGTAYRRAVVADVTYPTPESAAAWASDPAARVGQVVSDNPTAALVYAGLAPTDPSALRAYLAVGHPIDSYGSGELFVAITDLAQEQPFDGPTTAALLRVVAAAPGVTALGTVTDRAGRPGEAYAVDGTFTGLPTRWALVVDPTTGRLLASESWLTTSAGQLGIQVPACIDYRTFG